MTSHRDVSSLGHGTIRHSVDRSKAWRSRRTCGCLCALMILASPALLRAQFQEPTQEELKMTADPKAPGAAAIYLYREEVTDNPNRTLSYYVRIKVLAEKGKELATVSTPYEKGVDKVTQIEGRTIHADGSVVPLTAKPSDLMAIKTKDFQENSVIFTLPSAEVGSILEYRLKLERSMDWEFLPTWQIQKPYFIRKAHYSFRLGNYANMMYSTYVGTSGQTVQYKNYICSLDLTDIPPEPSDDWMPPMNTLRWRVEFFSDTGATTGQAYWDKRGKTWAESVNEFTKPTGKIKDALAGIIAPTDSEEQKAQKIYAAVMKLENTAFTRQKSKAERKKEKLKDINKAEDIWKQQAGSDDGIALLYVALARAAGLQVRPMKVVDRNRAMFDSSYLSTYQFDDFIVMLQLGGQKIYLDPGQKMCPFRSMSWKHTLATGMLFSEKGAEIATTPGLTYKDSVVKRVANLNIDETGNVKGAVSIVMTGPNSLRWRQLALQNDEDEVKKQFIESLRDTLPEGVEASFDHFQALDDSSANLVAVVNVSGNIGSATGKHFFLPGLFFESRAKHPFVAQDKRTIPIDVHFPEMNQDEVTYHLPPGFNVESMPSEANTTWPDHAILKIHSSAKDGSVTVQRTLAYNYTLLDPKEYSDLRGFYQKVAAADQQQLVLTRTPAPKGN
jgi:hypothetical protein